MLHQLIGRAIINDIKDRAGDKPSHLYIIIIVQNYRGVIVQLFMQRSVVV